MIPFLTHPLALLALGSLPALAAIYVLRNRFRRRKVSSLVLWNFHVQSRQGGAKVHRLQLPPLFFLELLILLLLVIAAAGPVWKLPQSTRPLIVVLDDSFSMHATVEGVSAQTRARAYLEKLFQRQPPPAVRLVLAGTEIRSLGPAVKSWSQVEELLKQWNCRAPGAALDSALTLASELGKQQANLLVLTDHRPADEKISNPRLEWHSFGLPLDNRAIVNASRLALGEQDRCLLEIANFSGNSRLTRVLVQTGTNSPQSSSLTLAPRETQRLIFDIPSATPSLRVTLEDDALAEDNRVELLPPIRHRVRVQVALADENLRTLANRTLEATGLRAALAENPDLVIHDTGPAGGSNAWSLHWLGASGSNVFTGPFVVDGSHPLAGGIALEGAVWAGATVTNSPGDVPAILAGNTPLLSAREDALGRKQLTLNFNPALSTLQNTPDWPVLFWNLLQWRITEMPGLKDSNARLGASVKFKTTGGRVTVTQPDGTARSFPGTGGELALETPLAGIYAVADGSGTNHFSVNTLAADESDLSDCASGHWGAWGEETARRLEQSSVNWIFALLALALLAGHLFLVASGKGGAR